jgi:endonuclease/exonuclease/phosphatase family metal-dependent hydrolase
MVLLSDLHDHARLRDDEDRQSDHGQAPPRLCRRAGRRGIPGRLTGFLAFILVLACGGAAADSIRVATFNTELLRDGPGLLLRDILRGEDPRIAAVLDTITDTAPDIIALQGVDHDIEHRSLRALSDALTENGLTYPHLFAAPPNAGRMTDLDLDGDGRTGGPGDAQGYGAFFGQGHMALLSRFPIITSEVIDFSALPWHASPNAMLPVTERGPFPSAAAQRAQRLHAHGAWVVPVLHPAKGRVTILTYHATPPVFDGPEDRNGRRNHDETRFWSLYLAGEFGPAPKRRVVLLGDANLDPEKGDGRGEAMQDLLANGALQDPLPGRPTVNWQQTGPLRVDYALPSADWQVIGAGVTEPGAGGSRHGLVWVDLAWPD